MHVPVTGGAGFIGPILGRRAVRHPLFITRTVGVRSLPLEGDASNVRTRLPVGPQK